MNDFLEARTLRRFGLRRGAYDGGRKRRFVLFANNGDGTESRHEFDSKKERDTKATNMLMARARFERIAASLRA